MSDSKRERPLTYSIAYWYGFVLAVIFLLYGGVEIILNILDRNYQNMAPPILFAALGVILFSVALAFRELKKWGWYGLICISVLVVLGSLLDIGRYENIIILVLSAAALYGLLASDTREYLKQPH
ncbi:MAG: hypothetical protein JSW34_11095 [Candidatus Zixiibacteriota bacterium]|nr:MAG: hypothetical protein JSW34_11095 [candidate division Zixibacteria bacterium]